MPWFRRSGSSSSSAWCALVAAAAAGFGTAAALAADLTIGRGADVTALDPHYHNVTPNNNVAAHIFGYLVQRNEKSQLEPGLATEVAAWFGAEIERRVRGLMQEKGLEAGQLLAPPRPDGRGSCSYCPRCQDQFVAGLAACPHGIALRPMGVAGDGTEGGAVAGGRGGGGAGSCGDEWRAVR